MRGALAPVEVATLDRFVIVGDCVSSFVELGFLQPCWSRVFDMPRSVLLVGVWLAFFFAIGFLLTFADQPIEARVVEMRGWLANHFGIPAATHIALVLGVAAVATVVVALLGAPLVLMAWFVNRKPNRNR